MLAEPLGVVHRSRYRRRRARSRSAVDCLGASQTRRDPKRTLRESAKDIAGISLTNKKFEPPEFGEGQVAVVDLPDGRTTKTSWDVRPFSWRIELFRSTPILSTLGSVS
jgi:hypothetical protein